MVFSQFKFMQKTVPQLTGRYREDPATNYLKAVPRDYNQAVTTRAESPVGNIRLELIPKEFRANLIVGSVNKTEALITTLAVAVPLKTARLPPELHFFQHP